MIVLIARGLLSPRLAGPCRRDSSEHMTSQTHAWSTVWWWVDGVAERKLSLATQIRRRATTHTCRTTAITLGECLQSHPSSLVTRSSTVDSMARSLLGGCGIRLIR